MIGGITYVRNVHMRKVISHKANNYYHHVNLLPQHSVTSIILIFNLAVMVANILYKQVDILISKNQALQILYIP